MNTFDMILDEMFKSGQIPQSMMGSQKNKTWVDRLADTLDASRSMMGSQKNKTWVDRLADALDARTQSVTQAKQQAKMLGTPLERQQLNFGPNPTEGPLATPAGIPAITPQVGTPAEEVNKYAPIKFGKFANKFANSLGNAADITGNRALSNAANLASVAKFMMK